MIEIIASLICLILLLNLMVDIRVQEVAQEIMYQCQLIITLHYHKIIILIQENPITKYNSNSNIIIKEIIIII